MKTQKKKQEANLKTAIAVSKVTSSLLTGEEDTSTPEMKMSEDEMRGMSESRQNKTKRGECWNDQAYL
jgi:hypothetical protein